ncbi:hypothetical protein G3I44_14440 [Halogeometricum borinquense]|uniref:Uncharacterized protein n=1 Tax=Halogeometricum borinquense TaxID=60847 RepID=A0A6C0UIW7_9EURY|nr:hypothetical protein [Halogeometricum borinquense]QIB75385.1 hypothetical protein G3I44_14440 [Halogeometricum borinquense]
MSQTVYIDGESVSIDEHTTGKELKAVAGADEDAELIHHDGDETVRIDDQDLVAEQVRDGAELIIEMPDEFEYGQTEPETTEDPSTGDEADEFNVIVNNEQIPVDPGTTAGELKSEVGADPDDVTVFRNPATEEDVNLHDNAVLEDHVPDGARISYQPGGQNTFGHATM